MNLLNGLGAFLKTAEGITVLIVAIVVILRAVVLWTKTKKDDEFLAKYGKFVFSAAEMAEKAIPDGSQTPALQFLDNALKAIAEGNGVDISDQKLMTVVKKQLVNVAKASTKVDTSPEELKKLKN